MDYSNKDYRVAIYIRLSKEDEGKIADTKMESESVVNQRGLLLSYVEKNGYKLVKEYVDDGVSGTTFNRPGFNKMIEDIESGKINMVITKDLSRLGRDYIQSGYYLEHYFPKKKVRYISVVDNIDTGIDNSNNEIAPFKSLFNDMQSKDTSKKIRSILKNKKEQGLFTGNVPSFGYKKDPLDNHKLLVDWQAAVIVKKIFKLAISGKSIGEISLYLNKNRIPTPSTYKNKKFNSNYRQSRLWTESSVRNILTNKMYTGCMIQGRQAKLNYKSKKRVFLSKDKWISVENTHEPIISKTDFYLVNSMMKNRKVVDKRSSKRILEGLIFCKECGGMLSVHVDKRNKNKNRYILNCNKYTRNPKLNLCCSHYLHYDKLEKEVLKLICRRFKCLDIDKIIKNIILKKEEKININKDNERREILKKIDLNNKKLISLYNDKFNKKISLDTYKVICESIEDENRSWNLQINELNLLLSKEKKKDIEKCKLIFNEICENKVTRNLAFLLINRILISKNKDVEIYYNFCDI